MFNKFNVKPKTNPWSDDHPEKLNQPPKKLDWKQQASGLASPQNFLDQMFSSGHSPEAPGVGRPERPTVIKEALIFSRIVREQDVQIERETGSLLDQLKKQVTLLEKSEKSLTREISKVKVEQMPKKTKGIYFLRYLEWLLTEVRKLRMKVEEGRTWLATFTQRQKKRVGYWKMYKKHGTTFGLSHERSIATQTG